MQLYNQQDQNENKGKETNKTTTKNEPLKKKNQQTKNTRPPNRTTT